MKRVVAAGALVLVGLGLAGCGDDGSDVADASACIGSGYYNSHRGFCDDAGERPPAGRSVSAPVPAATPVVTTPAAPVSPITFTCQGAVVSGGGTPQGTFRSLDEVWAAPDQFQFCNIEVAASYIPAGVEIEAANLYRQFVPDETDVGALKTMLGICSESDSASVDEVLRWQQVVLQGALLLCPNAPHAGLIRAGAEGTVIQDGRHVVGVDMAPGTWRTDGSVSDCYWERSTGGGDIIDNNFINFAPDGATVTVRASDGGFTSDGCGTWTLVG